MSQEEVVKAMIISMHLNLFNEAIDECTDKTLNLESSKQLKEMFKLSMEQICDAFIEVIKKIKKKNDKQ